MISVGDLWWGMGGGGGREGGVGAVLRLEALQQKAGERRRKGNEGRPVANWCISGKDVHS